MTTPRDTRVPIEGRDFFRIGCSRYVAKYGQSQRTPAELHAISFAKIVPCWSCRSRLAWDVNTSPERMWMVCIGCGRPWLVTIELTVRWIVLTFNVPREPRERRWSWQDEPNARDHRWEAYVETMLRLGEEPEPRRDWDRRQNAWHS